MAEITKLVVFLLWKTAVIMAMQGYLLTGPKSLLPNSIETFCVSIEGSYDHTAANCTLDLIAREDDVVYASVNQMIKGPKDCIKLFVPVTGETSARLRWRMRFVNLPDYTVDNIKEVALKKDETIHLIQTDKAWYTPGQLVRFRILSLNYILYPLLDPVKRVWVEDSTGTTVVQWVNLTTVHGLHQFELQLSVEPVQGTWTIQMERESQEKAVQIFEVREYVLPKFEVSVNGPPSIAFNQEGDNSVQKIPISVCAKYSYGQPVRGHWKAVIKMKDNGRSYHWRHKANRNEINLNREGVLNGETGCYVIKLAGDQLGISSYDGTFGKTLDIVATVTEQGTGIEMNTTWSKEVQRNTYKMDIANWSSNTFKRGLPYYGKIKVTTTDSQPAEGISVEICAHPTIVAHPTTRMPSKKPADIRNPPASPPKYCSFRQVDSNGFVSFELLPSEPEITEFHIKARIPKSIRKRRSVVPWYGGRNQDGSDETQLVINSLYSPSNSFMVFVPPSNYPKAVACLSILPVKLYFTADKDINFNVHYVVMARGDVMLTGVKQVKFREEDNIDLSLGETLLNQREVDGNNPELDSDVEASLKPVGDLEFEIEILPEMAPKISILAYYVRDDKEVVTAHIDIPIENCFPNPVKFSWSSKRKQPGQNVTMSLKGSSGSICGYSVVDRSVTFARPDLQISESTVYSRLPSFHISSGSYPFQVTPDWEYCANKRKESDSGSTEDFLRRKRSFIYQRPTAYSKDAMEAFDNAGLLVMSDLDIETRPCSKESMIYPLSLYRRGGFGRSLEEPANFDELTLASMPKFRTASRMRVQYSAASNEYEITPDLKPAVSVRSYFPETWLWDLITLNPQGEMNQEVELPHTITTWVGRALCVSESHGFGMSPAVNIEAFQPFFAELHLPYSVKRTEKLQLKISVFNYAPHSLPIRLTLAYSEQFELMSDSDSVLLCVPSKNSLVHHFFIHAIEIGKHNVSASATIDENYPGECGPEILPNASDNIIKELLVIPEGFPVERTHSHMACPKDFDEDKTIVWDLSLPDNLVEGSARAWVTAIGDLMGPALEGLSGLVRLPMGCGEQNMILFTPIIYVTQYLEATNQLVASFKNKAVNFMKSGYQRELTYRHADGSYSAFGKSDPEGSLWLTAFVVKSFAAARRYIHIDDKELQMSVRWLKSKQLENGCFPVVGTVLHKDLKGGLTDSEDNMAPLTAFTLISLLEMLYSQDNTTTAGGQFKSLAIDKLLNDTLPCLEPDETNASDLYTKALTVYALTLAGQSSSARDHIKWLMARAQNSSSSLLWWEKPGSGPALNVEMTSYILLSLVKLGSNEDLIKARAIVRWLSKQRNSEGGFVSTQDTVVALQAISAYASLIGTQSVDMELLVTAGEFEHYVRIREQDRLVQRRIDLPLPLNPQVNIDTVGEGNGCVILQATLRYNVRTPPPSAAFHLNVTSMTLTDVTGQMTCHHKLTVCSRFIGSQDIKESNMALIEIGFVSGYQINKASLNPELLTNVKRHELNGDNLVLYFDQITSEKDSCISLVVQHAFKVNDTKDANVKIYDYYQPEHSKSVSYSLPNECSSSASKLEPWSSLAGSLVLSSPSPLVSKIEEDDPTDVTVEVIRPLKKISDDLSPIQAGVRSASNLRNSSQKEDKGINDFDLQVPDGDEAPIPTFVLPGHIRGCPRCISIIPEDFHDFYCKSKTVYLAETRPSRGHRLRLINDFSARHIRPIKTNSSVDILLEKHCKCDFFQKDAVNRSVTVLGLPLAPHPTPPEKLAVGPELLIIDKNPKQLNLKSIRIKCDKIVP